MVSGMCTAGGMSGKFNYCMIHIVSSDTKPPHYEWFFVIFFQFLFLNGFQNPKIKGYILETTPQYFVMPCNILLFYL